MQGYYEHTTVQLLCVEEHTRYTTKHTNTLMRMFQLPTFNATSLPILTKVSLLVDRQYKIIKLLTSYEVNIESCAADSGCFPRGIFPRENDLSMIGNLMFTKYEGNNCFYYTETTLIYFKIWMFCFVEDSKIISDIANTIMQPHCKNTIQNTSGCKGL